MRPQKTKRPHVGILDRSPHTGALVETCRYLMTWESTVEVLARLRVLPSYSAVMEWVPAASVVVLKVADPLALKVSTAMVAVPSLKETLPVGVGPVAGVTLAVKVTLAPAAAGLSEEDTVVEVAAFLTVCDTALEVLVR